MRLIATKQFWRGYDKLPESIQGQVDRTLTLLEENPHHPGLRIHKRQGEKDVWQARVTRNYRLYFQMEGETITLLSISAHEK